MKERKTERILKVVVMAGLCLIMAGVVAYAEPEAPAAATPAPAAPAAPEIVEISTMVNMFDSVTFTHESHVGYADNCATCHHHSEAGQTPACATCHPKAAKVDGPTYKTSLKAAYHQQCMGCHKEMGSGPMGCTDCHPKKQKPATEGNQNQQGE